MKAQTATEYLLTVALSVTIVLVAFALLTGAINVSRIVTGKIREYVAQILATLIS